VHFGCTNPLEPSEILGNWTARTGHFDGYEIRFTQEGAEVGGEFCSYSGLTLGWSGVPVTVSKKNHVTFQAPQPAPAGTFEGQFTSDRRQLRGSFTINPSYELVFERGGTGLCTFAH
jgi:hypothetical protein